MSYLTISALIFLIIFTLVASIDGIYFHLFKYKLYSRPESIKEHHLHTLNSFLFPFTIVFLFIFNTGGLLLWLAVILTILTLIVEFVDVFEEKKSRMKLGGLTSLEYSMHFGMSGIRATYTTLVFAGKPLFAWSLSAPLLIPLKVIPYPFSIITLSVAILGIPIFIIHYYLGRKFEKK
jgi:hypothetical protein